MRRTLLVSLGVVVTVGLIGYAAHSMNLVGTLLSMHSPPPYG